MKFYPSSVFLDNSPYSYSAGHLCWNSLSSLTNFFVFHFSSNYVTNTICCLSVPLNWQRIVKTVEHRKFWHKYCDKHSVLSQPIVVVWLEATKQSVSRIRFTQNSKKSRNDRVFKSAPCFFLIFFNLLYNNAKYKLKKRWLW